MDMLLREGAYYMGEQNDAEIEEFRKQDIDTMLANRTYAANRASGGNSAFSRVTLMAERPEELTDPQFWQSRVQKVDLAAKPRVRKQNQRYVDADVVISSDWNKSVLKRVEKAFLQFGWGKISAKSEFLGSEGDLADGSAVILDIAGKDLFAPHAVANRAPAD
jgi:hypothetical protein